MSRHLTAEHLIQLHQATRRTHALAETLARQLHATDWETVERAAWLAGLLRTMAFEQAALLAATRAREFGAAGPELYVAAARLHALVEAIDDELQSTAIDDVNRAAWLAQQAALLAADVVKASDRLRDEFSAAEAGPAATATEDATH